MRSDDTRGASLGRRIRAERQRHGLTQAQLAARAGVTAITVSRWERDVEEPRLGAARRLARAFGHTLLWFDELPAGPAIRRLVAKSR